MTFCININEVTTKQEIMGFLASVTDDIVSVIYDTKDKQIFNRSEQNDEEIADIICDYITEQQSYMDEGLAALSKEPTEEDLDEMFADAIRKHEMMMDAIGDCEEAVLHHWL